MSEASVFGDGIISAGDFDSHPAFMPDGRTLYFVRSMPNFNLWTVLVSRFERGKWSGPEVAPFSGQYSDADPFITPDGKWLYSPDGKYFFWTSVRTFADKPLEKRMNYREFTNKLRSPNNGLGDIYQIDLSELKIQQ